MIKLHPSAALIAGLALSTQGCCHRRPPRAPLPGFGAPADVTTKSGVYDGYRITTECASPGVAYAIFGEAGKPLAPELLALVKDELAGPAVRDIDAHAGIGQGRACDGGGLSVTLSSWAYVDPAVTRLALLVRLLDLQVQIAIRVVPSGNKLLD